MKNNAIYPTLLRALAFLLALAVATPAGGGALASPPQAPSAVIQGNWSWPTGDGLSDVVEALALDSGGNLYAGGQFNDASGDLDADRIALWDGSSWSWPSGAGTFLDSNVYTLIFDGSGMLHAGGNFTDAGADPDCDHWARWFSGIPAWSCPTNGTLGPNGYINALVFDGSSLLYAGGVFVDGGDGVGGIDDDCDYICVWDANSWSWPTDMGLSSFVYALVWDGANVYASGTFIDAGGDTGADRIAKWTGSAWDDVGGGLSDTVAALVVDGGDLYAGGAFVNAGGDADADKVAVWDGIAWSWPSGGGFTGFVFSITMDGAGTLYAGGSFADGGGDADADNIAYWDGAAWSWPTGLGLNDFARELAWDSAEGVLYVGGAFTDAGGDDDCDRICKFTPNPAFLFADGFESGDFSAWTSFNDGSGNLTVEMPCAMEGTYGMCALSTNNKRKQVIDSVPNDEVRYYASFQLDHNNVSISGAANRIRIFQGRMDTHFPFILLLRYSGGNRQVMLRLQTDAGPGNYVDSAWYTISDAVHTIGVDWSQSSGADDGYGNLYVDGILQGVGNTVSGVDNDTLVIRGIRLGITTRMDGITLTGTLYFDDFYSDNDGYPE